MKSFRQIIQYDSELGHKYVPNQFARLSYGNGGYFIETDANGFRNSNFNGSAKTRILLIGDSFAAGDGVSNARRFGDILQRRFDCEVINLAVSGYGVDQQVLAYEKYHNSIEHDLVLFVPHLDDLKRNLLEARTGIDKSTDESILIPKPVFKIENDQLVLRNTPVPKERIPSEEPLSGESNTFVARGKRYIKKRVLKSQLHPELSNENSNEWKLMHHIIDRLKVSTGIKPVYAIPLPYYDSVTYFEKPKYLDQFKKHDSNLFSTLDITELLYPNYNLEDDRIFLPLCGHFTPFAHELIADYIGEYLVSQRQLSNRLDSIDSPEINANYILGISCLYHDSGAALIKDGEIIAAVQEERFTRIKHDKSFPINGINYCLEEARISINDVSAIVYYDYETWTIERVIHNALAIGDKGEDFWKNAGKSLYTKLKLPHIIRQKTGYTGEIGKSQHHVSHAAGAFYPSPFDEAAILVIDGVGEWACSTIAEGSNKSLKLLKQQHYPHSVGLLYSAFTYFCGFKVNSGEYKLMGLAPYGEPIYANRIKERLIDIRDDGSIFLNLEYFSFLEGEKMTNEKFADLFDGPARERESDITRREMNLAASIQKVTEEIVIKMANHAYKITGKKNLVMSGGVALNCVSNGKLYDETPFKDFYFQPASGDAGGAVGCALNWYFEHEENTIRKPEPNAYLGPAFSSDEINAFLNTRNVKYHKFDQQERAMQIATMLNSKKIIGYFDGRMEFGPRALGNRSIIANPMDVEMQSKLNLKIKFRESFRPFAPIYAEERTEDYFDFDRPSPYMLVVREVNKNLLIEPELDQSKTDNMIEIVNQKRSELPAITHVDNSARLQSVNHDQNPRFHDILMEFEKQTGKAVLINTSFNVRGEPIVCTPNDAYKCFMRTNMDVLVLNDHYLIKSEQPDWKEIENWEETFELD